MNIAREILDQQSRLESERSTYDNHCTEVAQIMLTRQDDFFNVSRTEGEKRTERKYDDTATLALERFSAAMESILVPRTQTWHRLKIDELENDHEAQLWLEDVNDLLFKRRYSPKANYASQQHETFMSLGAFGTGVMIVEDIIGVGLRYKSSHISEHYFMENGHGKIDVNYRKYRLTARQAAERFGEENLPPQIKMAYDKKPHEKFWFVHYVGPNEDTDIRINGEVAPFFSFHVAMEGQKLLSPPGGFKTFPYIISRYVTSPNEIYGRSPGMTVLAEAKMLNAMRKSDIRARNRAVDPPNLVADEGSVRKISLKPNSLIYGGLDEAGRPRMQPYNNGARIDLSNDAIQQSREFINDTFLVTLFQILVDSPAMTATEVLQRAQEKGALLAPTMGRQQSEALGPMIEREISILETYGLFEDDGPFPMPPSIKEREGSFEIDYTSPLSRLQKSEEALGTQRTVESALPFVQLEPEIMDNFNLDEFIQIMKEANGAPSKLMRSEEEKEVLRKARQEQKRAEALIAAAPTVTSSVKDIAQAQALQ